MANIVGIVGEPGTGKTTSFRNMDPDSTYIINVQGKPLPFKGSASSFNRDKKNLANLDKWSDVITVLQGVSTTRPEIKSVIVDDAGFIMATEFFKRASENGFNKFSEIGQHMFNIIDAAKKLREDLTVVFTFHSDDSVDPMLGMGSKKIKTIGKMLAEKYSPEASMTVLLYTHVDFDKDGKANYQFITNRTETYPAKSPMGMFEDLTIPNDLNTVIQTIENYYK